jgi:adenylate cyclase
MERRLAAILAADVVGYSRLIRADEEGTIAALKALRADLIDPKIAQHHGRIVKLMGDGMLAEFPSVVDAVRAAVETQLAVAEHNSGLPEDKRIVFRVGINLGDVIIDGDDIHGDGVNIAARLEGLSDPGGICISGAVYDQVRDRIDLSLEDLGDREVKNIDRPVRVWRWLPVRGVTAGDPAPPERPLPLPDKPSIVVLPFTNMSGDPEQEYFSDGITEDIITELSRFSSLLVIARHSSFAYKGRSVDVGTIGRELGVAYVVEGSVRKVGQRIRISAQLVETATGSHLWAERFDRALDDIFAIQDEVVQIIVATLPVRLETAGAELAGRKRPESLTAYDCLLRGHLHWHRFTKEDNAKARSFYAKAVDLDPRYARAYALLAATYNVDAFSGWAAKDSTEETIALVHRALALDSEETWARMTLGWTLLRGGQYDEADMQFERAITINPNDAEMLAWSAMALTYLGRPEDALENITRAIRLNPLHSDFYHVILGIVSYLTRQYHETIRALQEVTHLDRLHRAYLAAAFAQLGLLPEARSEVAIYRELSRKEIEVQGKMDLENETSLVRARVNRYRRQSDRDHILEGLRKAGLRK